MAATSDLPALHHPRCLPGRAWPVLLARVVRADHFEDTPLSAQALVLVLLTASTLLIAPTRLAAARCGTPPSAADTLLAPDAGWLYCRPEPLLDAVFRRPAGEDGAATPSAHWPLRLPLRLAELFRLHQHAAAQARGAAPLASGAAPAALWVSCADGTVRALDGAFVDAYVADCAQPAGYPLLSGDLIRFGEALALRATSPVCPGALPHLGGGTLMRYLVGATYQAPTVSERSWAARAQWAGVRATLTARCASWSGDGWADAAALTRRLRRWLGADDAEA